MIETIKEAKNWAAMDPCPKTCGYVAELVACAESNDKKSCKELKDLFPGENRRIGFGTAGLRSSMKPGPMGMNDLTVVQATQGLVRYCESVSSSDEPLRAVIGYDHRKNDSLDISSRSMAIFSTLVFQQAGFECILLDGYIPTPLVAFATAHWKCTVGIMLTASHNPKQDAGFKVYWNDGCQIRSPLDTGIASSILQNLTPWTNYGTILSKIMVGDPGDSCFGLSSLEKTKQLAAAYFNSLASSGLVTGQMNLLKTCIETRNKRPPVIAYTAMHGVGLDYAIRSYEVFGIPPFHAVPSQSLPDADFPSVPFPNPEEKGALNIAMAFAEENGCDLVLANDPDADRLAVAERDRNTQKWTTFSGDQIGVMLGHWLWENIGKQSKKPVAMCASTVSSAMLSTIAEVDGFHFEDTLTGFKWIGSRLAALEKEGFHSILGYEEAIGFACGDVVHDKDGISALGVVTELAYHVYCGSGISNTLVQHMQSLYDKYGEFVSKNGYFFFYDQKIIHNIINKIRNGGNYPKKVGEYEVLSIRDLGVPSYDSTTKDKKPTLPTSASSPMITMKFTNGCVAHFRASGTEPKFKYYIELRGKPGVSRKAVSEALDIMVPILLEELLHPESSGLIKP